MGLGKIFHRKKDVVAIEINNGTIKLVSLNTASRPYTVLNIAESKLPIDAISNNFIIKKEIVTEKLVEMLIMQQIGEAQAVVSIPSACVFTKHITMSKLPYKELKASVDMETANFLPPSVGNVKIDFHIIKEIGKKSYELLIAAAKEDIINNYVEVVSAAGLEVVVIDVNSFALQNCFELAYPEKFSDSVVVIDMGTRNSDIAICKNGQPILNGDLSIGSRAFCDALVSNVGVQYEEAEQMISGIGLEGEAAAVEVIHQKTTEMVSELKRQLNMFWSASGAEGIIDKIYIAGEGVLLPGFVDEINKGINIQCEVLDPFRKLKFSDGKPRSSFDEALLAKMAVPVGLAIRQADDKEFIR